MLSALSRYMYVVGCTNLQEFRYLRKIHTFLTEADTKINICHRTIS